MAEMTPERIATVLKNEVSGLQKVEPDTWRISFEKFAAREIRAAVAAEREKLTASCERYTAKCVEQEREAIKKIVANYIGTEPIVADIEARGKE